jgi:hypothetical protein
VLKVLKVLKSLNFWGTQKITLFAMGPISS